MRAAAKSGEIVVPHSTSSASASGKAERKDRSAFLCNEESNGPMSSPPVVDPLSRSEIQPAPPRPSSQPQNSADLRSPSKKSIASSRFDRTQDSMEKGIAGGVAGSKTKDASTSGENPKRSGFSQLLHRYLGKKHSPPDGTQMTGLDPKLPNNPGIGLGAGASSSQDFSEPKNARDKEKKKKLDKKARADLRDKRASGGSKTGPEANASTEASKCDAKAHSLRGGRSCLSSIGSFIQGNILYPPKKLIFGDSTCGTSKDLLCCNSDRKNDHLQSIHVDVAPASDRTSSKQFSEQDDHTELLQLFNLQTRLRLARRFGLENSKPKLGDDGAATSASSTENIRLSQKYRSAALSNISEDKVLLDLQSKLQQLSCQELRMLKAQCAIELPKDINDWLELLTDGLDASKTQASSTVTGFNITPEIVETRLGTELKEAWLNLNLSATAPAARDVDEGHADANRGDVNQCLKAVKAAYCEAAFNATPVAALVPEQWKASTDSETVKLANDPKCSVLSILDKELLKYNPDNLEQLHTFFKSQLAPIVHGDLAATIESAKYP